MRRRRRAASRRRGRPHGRRGGLRWSAGHAARDQRRRRGVPGGRRSLRHLVLGSRRAHVCLQARTPIGLEPQRLMPATAMLTECEVLEAQLFGAPAVDAQLKFTDAMILAMLNAGEGLSDLIFAPGRPPQIEQHGELVAVPTPAVAMLDSDHTARVARELIGGSEHALRTLKDHGACDLSYAIPSRARFRVNIFRQRGSFAIVMRVIATRIPTLSDLGLPSSLEEIASLKNGIVLVTGPTGSGKS